MVWLALASVMIVIVGWLLFAPFYLEIDSRQHLYRIRFHHFASVRLYAEPELYLVVKVAFWKRRIDFAEKEMKYVSEKKQKVKRKRAHKTPVAINGLFHVLKSFRLNKLIFTLDTGVVFFNGILYPCFSIAGWKTKRDISINFVGKNELVIETENNIARMLWAYYTHK